jgi:hypothetical protein
MQSSSSDLPALPALGRWHQSYQVTALLELSDVVRLVSAALKLGAAASSYTAAGMFSTIMPGKLPQLALHDLCSLQGTDRVWSIVVPSKKWTHVAFSQDARA